MARAGKYGTREYPLTTLYVRTWDTTDALREIIANALDCEREFGAKAKPEFKYDEKTKTLWVRNRGVTVGREALLLGGTSKSDRNDTIGTFGEGMKVAFLVFAREKVSVTVKNGTDETWRPSIRHSETWGGNVLALEIVQASRREPMFEVEISPVDGEFWQETQARFTALAPKEVLTGTVMPEREAKILTHPDRRGWVYVRGVYVDKREGLRFGYDFHNAELNRDRKAATDLDDQVAYALSAYARLGDQQRAEVYDLLLEDTASEVEMVRWYAGSTICGVMLAEFVKRHGEKTIIVRHPDEAAKVRHFGETAVVVPDRLFQILSYSPSAFTFTKFSKEANTKPSKVYRMEEIPGEQRVHYENAAAVLKAAVPTIDLSRVSIVDFHNDSLLGLHRGIGGEVLVARKNMMKGTAETLSTLIHEYAHDYGPDGDKGHIAKIEEYTEATYRILLRGTTLKVTIESPRLPPQVIEKVVERVVTVEKVVEKPVPAPVRPPIKVVTPTKRAPVVGLAAIVDEGDF